MARVALPVADPDVLVRPASVSLCVLVRRSSRSASACCSCGSARLIGLWFIYRSSRLAARYGIGGRCTPEAAKVAGRPVFVGPAVTAGVSLHRPLGTLAVIRLAWSARGRFSRVRVAAMRAASPASDSSRTVLGGRVGRFRATPAATPVPTRGFHLRVGKRRMSSNPDGISPVPDVARAGQRAGCAGCDVAAKLAVARHSITSRRGVPRADGWPRWRLCADGARQGRDPRSHDVPRPALESADLCATSSAREESRRLPVVRPFPTTGLIWPRRRAGEAGFAVTPDVCLIDCYGGGGADGAASG